MAFSCLMAVLLLAQQAAEEPFRDFPETDVLSYDIQAEIDLEHQALRGFERIRMRAEDALRSVRLHARTGPGWTLTFLRGVELAVTRLDPDTVRIELGEEVAKGEELELEVRFAGTPPDGLTFGRTRGGEPCVYTDHYSIRARGWLPCEDHPGDRALFSLALEVPKGLQAVGTGGLEPVEELPDGRTLWKARCASALPTYLLAFAVGRWERIPESGDARLLPHFVYPQDREAAAGVLRHHASWMKSLEQRIGPYPYGSYCIVQVPTRWGGMENAGNTWVMESLFDTAAGRSVPGGALGTLAHELAHQWFGDGVGYADWREVWLSEGFASYFGPLLEAEAGGPALAESMRRARERWLAAPEGRELAVRWRGFAHPDLALNANSYPKGAWVLHMLRKELGDEAFFSGLASYYRQNVGTAVTTDTLRAALEAASGRALGAFFAQWLDRPGCPELEARWDERGLELVQVQPEEPFEFLLPLRWTAADGRALERDVRVRERRQRIDLEGAPIRDGVLDPGVELLFRPAGR